MDILTDTTSDTRHDRHPQTYCRQDLCLNRCSTRAGDLQAIVVSNPKVAAAVAEICMVGLAATVQATKGPPKPDKARIDRLAYVVSEPRLSLRPRLTQLIMV